MAPRWARSTPCDRSASTTLSRRAAYVQVSDPLVQGNADVKYTGRSRRVTLYGVGPDFTRALKLRVASGEFLPQEDPRSARAFAVLGSKVARELFGGENPLGP